MNNKKYIITERAHLMCPNMNFGIMAKIDDGYDSSKMQRTLDLLMSAHPLLKSVVAKEETTGKLYYKVQDDLKLSSTVQDSADLWKEDYHDATKDGWNVFKEGLLKVLVYPGVNQFDVLFICHHLLCDGRGALGLACEFADCYVEGKKPSFVDENLIRSIDDLPPDSDLPFISKLVINHANKNWEKEGHSVSYDEYSSFERNFLKEDTVSYKVETVDSVKVEELLAECRKEKVSLNDYLVAEMMCREHTNKVVIAADIRKDLAIYKHGALGNYATAMGITSSLKSDDIFTRAKDVSKQIKKHLSDNKKRMLVLACYLQMTPELIDAVAISTLGNFKSKTGKFVGSDMFGYEKRNGYSVTNLGNIENANIVEAMFIPPASPANKVTVGVLSVNNKMKKCSAIVRFSH